MGKGFEGWIEIFKTGTHTDSKGHTKTWGDSDLELIVSMHDPKTHEVPLVIGHPESNAPAYGWVEGLKKEGMSLFMKARDIIPEFAEMVKRGLFKKRSISIYPNGTLRHVGFLGAAAPAIKGLKDISFKEGAEEGATFEFEQEADAGDRLERLIELKMKEEPDLTYSEAWSKVGRENPELAAEYAGIIVPSYRNTNTRSLIFGEALDQLIKQKMTEESNLTYSEAFLEVTAENEKLTEAHMLEVCESNKAEDVAAYEFMSYIPAEQYERTLRMLDLLREHPSTDHRGRPIDWGNEPIKVAADLVDDQFPKLKKRLSDQQWEELYKNLRTVLGFPPWPKKYWPQEQT